MVTPASWVQKQIPGVPASRHEQLPGRHEEGNGSHLGGTKRATSQSSLIALHVTPLSAPPQGKRRLAPHPVMKTGHAQPPSAQIAIAAVVSPQKGHIRVGAVPWQASSPESRFTLTCRSTAESFSAPDFPPSAPLPCCTDPHPRHAPTREPISHHRMCRGVARLESGRPTPSPPVAAAASQPSHAAQTAAQPASSAPRPRRPSR